MIALKRLKMKKMKNFMSSKEEVRNARIELEEKTEDAFREFDRSRQAVREMARTKLLD